MQFREITQNLTDCSRSSACFTKRIHAVTFWTPWVGLQSLVSLPMSWPDECQAIRRRNYAQHWISCEIIGTNIKTDYISTVTQTTKLQCKKDNSIYANNWPGAFMNYANDVTSETLLRQTYSLSHKSKLSTSEILTISTILLHVACNIYNMTLSKVSYENWWHAKMTRGVTVTCMSANGIVHSLAPTYDIVNMCYILETLLQHRLWCHNIAINQIAMVKNP